MLELKNITKSYAMENVHQVALNNVSLAFRPTEFVSILGPSGSGKTTLLNIIGGLDKYDNGDLVINGVSTKEYADRDWDTYRNHSIGFVFQNYNLIGHQSVLSNVEMALTLSGVAKGKRKKMALEALEKVGLSEHVKKKPNQLSGGQMQRVAIARALVNNPDIILADEPTGALDTETSLQVMKLLKEISKDKLVIMVTHNPELAEQYSTRIIRVMDGKITGDSNPFKILGQVSGEKPKKKTSMSFLTALSLSFNNLLTKKGRTALTSFAGSIGIIGIALILAISTGVQGYIDTIQRDTLSSYPIIIEKETTDMTALMTTMMGISPDGEMSQTHNNDAVYANPIMYRMVKAMLNAEVETNNLEAFKTYLDENREDLAPLINSLQYGYDIDLNIYATDANGKYAKADFADLLQEVFDGGSMVSSMTSVMESSGGVDIWQELITEPGSDEISALVKEQYDLVYGEWPTEANEILLVLTPNNEISDITLYALGLVDRQTMINSTMAAMTGKEDDSFDKYIGKSWSYEEICNIPLKMILPTDYYQYDESTKLWVDISENTALMDSVIDKGAELHIAGIVRPNPDATSAFLNGALCYTSALTEQYIEKINASPLVQAQKANTTTNLISGLPFTASEEGEMSDEAKKWAFIDYEESLTDIEKAELYEEILARPNETFIQETIDTLLKEYEDKTAEDIVEDIVVQYSAELGYNDDLIRDMLSGYEKQDLIDLLETAVREMIVSQYAENAAKEIERICLTPSDAELEMVKGALLEEMYASIAELPETQQVFAKQQIDYSFVAQAWSKNTGIDAETAVQHIASLSSESFARVYDKALTELAIETYANYGTRGSMTSNAEKIAAVFDLHMENVSGDDLLYYYENHMPDKVSEQSYDGLLDSIGVVAENSPAFINIYPVDFDAKGKIAEIVDNYNNGVSQDDQIEYTDIVAVLMSSVSDIINAISAILIGFVSISLIVSSIMIGIITYVSVLERTKEIGILRAVGASKKDIARVFNAETTIVGLLAGFVGIAATLLLCIPLNIIVRDVTGIESLTAVLPPEGYLLVILSVALTLIAGLFPAKMAAKKDPVIALRSE